MFTDEPPKYPDEFEPIFPIDRHIYNWRHLTFDLIDGVWHCRPYKTSGSTGYLVYDEYGLDGGGRQWGYQFPLELKKLYPDRLFIRCLDWCSGPGYCGFEMLDHGIAESLVLMDLHQKAIDYANITIDKNSCQDNVKSYCLDQIGKLPASEKFDLVIGNPPHSPDVNHRLDFDQTRILSDVGWNTHKEFFDNIGNYLTEDGVIWLCENISQGAGPPKIFKPMIQQNGFKIRNMVYCDDHEIQYKPYYYLEIVRV